MFLVPAYPGSLGPKAVKRLCICLRLFTKQVENQKQTQTDRKIVQITYVQLNYNTAVNLIVTQQLIKLIRNKK